MHNGIKCAFIFSTGAILGSVVTWKLLKTKYENIAKEEIESVKAVFSSKKYVGPEQAEEVTEEQPQAEERIMVTKDKPSIMDYASKLAEEGYYDYSSQQPEEKNNKEVPEMKEPYVITPDEYEESGYETSSLTYYADGVLTDEYDDVIYEIDEIVGIESLKHFGEYEEDCVYVRNDSLQRDYQVVYDDRRFEDVFGTDE